MSSGHSQLAESGLNQVLRLWTPGPGPLYRGLAAALREAIQRGQLPDGSRLPSERQLAERLLISRTTVVAAYDLLRQENLVERRQGSGTHVRFGVSMLARATERTREDPSEALGRNTLFRGLTDLREDSIDLVRA